MTIDTIPVLDTDSGPTPPASAPTFVDPPEEPPIGIAAELLWRVAVRLFQDHGALLIRDDEVTDEVADDEPDRCRRCRQPWPCSGRRLAELALKSAASGPVRLESQSW